MTAIGAESGADARPVNQRFREYLAAHYPISLVRGRYMPYLLVGLTSVVLFVAAVILRQRWLIVSNLIVFLIATRGIIGLKQQYEKQKNIADHWLPVLAVLVQANQGLFRTGMLDLPCLVLFTFEPLDYATLNTLAERMGALKNTDQTDPDLQAVAAMVTQEAAVRYRRRPLPVSFTGGPTVYAADLFVVRRCLELGYLTHRLLPCFAEPGESGGLELMPWQVAAPPENAESSAAENADAAP